MGKRHTGRKLAFQALFQMEVREDKDDIVKVFLEDADIFTETKKWAISLAQGAWEHHSDSDELITTFAKGWEFDRINAIDKSILRLAFYELNHSETPPNIVIDEAIEIAKQFSTEDSPKFINGILGHYLEKKCSPDSSKK